MYHRWYSMLIGRDKAVECSKQLTQNRRGWYLGTSCFEFCSTGIEQSIIFSLYMLLLGLIVLQHSIAAFILSSLYNMTQALQFLVICQTFDCKDDLPIDSRWYRLCCWNFTSHVFNSAWLHPCMIYRGKLGHRSECYTEIYWNLTI